MKILHLMLLTHVSTAAICCLAFGLARLSTENWIFASAAIGTLVVCSLSAWVATRQLKRGLDQLELVSKDYLRVEAIGLAEFDQLLSQLAQDAKHWESVASENRSQAREFQNMISMLDRRSKGDPTSKQLRGVLGGLGRALSDHLGQLQQGAVEVEQFAKSITVGADSQGHAVTKTTSYIEQLSTTIDNVSTGALSAQSALVRTEKTASSALNLLSQLSEGIRQVQSESLSCEKNVRALSDPTRQIAVIVDSISDIAARTDLLALNASIESIRAGEHGRGFAVVADEVRKLAEQATEATREISSLLNSMQITTQESLRGIFREREQVDAELRRVEKAEGSLREIGQLGQEIRCIEQIHESANQQIQLTQEVIEAVEQISGLAKSNRCNAESAGWTVKSLATGNPHIDSVVERLSDCTEPSHEDPALNSTQSSDTHNELAPVS